MDKHPTTSGLSPDKLAKFWNIGSEADKADLDMDEDSRKTELLQDLLAEMLPDQSPTYKLNKREKTQLQSVIGSIANKAIGELIKSSGTDVALLRIVKEYGKKLSDNAKTKAEYHMANTIYYAAIASALVFHDKRITKFSYKDLENYFRRLVSEKWIPETLRDLFAKATEHCQIRQGHL